MKSKNKTGDRHDIFCSRSETLQLPYCPLPLTYSSSNLPLLRQIKALVDKILARTHPVPSGHPSIRRENTPSPSTRGELTQSDITALEREIDMLVYRLYNLTDEEISIIENDGK
ncbi:MAG: hypothetical protein ABIK31_06805 [candidate division WOR-3 bacterium]